ncbi:MAG: cell division protein FtsZ, partial [bacterium]
SLFEVNEAANIVFEAAHEDAHIIFGSVIDEDMGDEIRVTVIATGFGSPPAKVLVSGAEALEYGNGPRLKVVGGDSYDLSPLSTDGESAPKESEMAPPAGDVDFLSYDEKEWEVPAFLRKQAD